MLDGEHYTTLEETADGVPAIQRYRYQDGALAGTIVTLTDLVAGGAPEAFRSRAISSARTSASC